MLSQEMRDLERVWDNNRWPHFLQTLELTGVRGWTGQRIEFPFPVVAISGENGSGKSTIIQAAASIYRNAVDPNYFASSFFPETAWDNMRNIIIGYSLIQGNRTVTSSLRRRTARWRGNPGRVQRPVAYLDLRRTQPIYARTGYKKLASRIVRENNTVEMSVEGLTAFSAILGKQYISARQATTNIDPRRSVPVIRIGGDEYSGFHQGGAENLLADMFAEAFPMFGLILIDEIETSLHPRAQRRLVRELARLARINHNQFILTTHSPYVLEELPTRGRIHIMMTERGRSIVAGASPEISLSKMDELLHTEGDVYVEDDEAKVLIEEIINIWDIDLLQRVEIVPYGSASVGIMLGDMVVNGRFRRPTAVILDGDQLDHQGCFILPGGSAPERVVFDVLKNNNWLDVSDRIGRSADQINEAYRAIEATRDHHEWIDRMSERLGLNKDYLWRALCRCFVDQYNMERVIVDILVPIKRMIDEH